MKREPGFTSRPKFRHSLMSRYLLIVFFALLFIPIIFPLTGLVYLVTGTVIHHQKAEGLKYGSAANLEQMWHQQAAAMEGYSPQQIDHKLQDLKKQYPDASFFWVDADGNTQLQLPQQAQLPVHWTQADAIRFMKASMDSEPFTVVAFIGKDNGGSSFMVLQMPRPLLRPASTFETNTTFYIAFIFMMFAFFVVMSLLFFKHIRSRLLRLQAAMELHGPNGLPLPIVQTKQDEIGQLEAAFNEMVDQLRDSQQREREEEELRKRLISNLSHDLRTPLTVMNSHIYLLQMEEVSALGRESIKQVANKIVDLGSLIENLLSYTLMTSGRYPLRLEQLDVLRLVRESAAAWYPLWEKEGIEAEVEVPEQPLMWKVDKEGFRRILDNLFQNVVRHAAKGEYIGISLEQRREGFALVIADRGEGVESATDGAGAGIGLAIVDYLIREMGLEWQTESDGNGTRIRIWPKEEGRFLNQF